MYHHVKKLMFTVRVDEPDVRICFSNSSAAQTASLLLQCNIQSRASTAKILTARISLDIGTEELSHLEVVGTLSRMHPKPAKFDRQAAEVDPLIAMPAAAASIFSTRTSKSPESSTSTCAATSQRKRAQRSSTNG
jgi:Mn-containing catalase